MKLLTAAAALVVQLVSAVAASDPCIEFMEHHLTDPRWEQACIEWLESLESPSSAVPSDALMMESGSASASSVTSVRHLSVSNLTLAADNQLEAFIAADPNSSRVFAFVMTQPFLNGLFAAHSTDHGTTWSPSKIAVGPGGAIPAGRADPWAVFGDEGRLFISYIYDFNVDETEEFGIASGVVPTIVAKSNDGGASFQFIEAFEPDGITDRGSMATGPGGTAADGSIWAIYRDVAGGLGTGRVVVRGAALDAAGDPIEDFCGPATGYFCVEQTIAEDAAVPNTFVFPGHISVGSNGEVLATYYRTGLPSVQINQGPVNIFASVDTDGLGSAQTFPSATPPAVTPVLTTNVGFRDQVTPHFQRRIAPLANLAWDRISGRIYLVSTTEEPQESNETDIVLLTSDDNGLTWSVPKRVNDDPPPTLDGMGSPIPAEVRSQFFPHVSVDRTTGHVAVAWHDPRNDTGGSDGTPNTETEVFVAISTDEGSNFSNAVVSEGVSRAISSDTSHGDYLGVSFHGGIAHVAWADNSNSTGDNPDATLPGACGTVPCMDAYTARVGPEPGSAQQIIAGVLTLVRLARRRIGNRSVWTPLERNRVTRASIRCESSP